MPELDWEAYEKAKTNPDYATIYNQPNADWKIGYTKDNTPLQLYLGWAREWSRYRRKTKLLQVITYFIPRIKVEVIE